METTSPDDTFLPLKEFTVSFLTLVTSISFEDTGEYGDLRAEGIFLDGKYDPYTITLLWHIAPHNYSDVLLNIAPGAVISATTNTFELFEIDGTNQKLVDGTIHAQACYFDTFVRVCPSEVDSHWKIFMNMALGEFNDDAAYMESHPLLELWPGSPNGIGEMTPISRFIGPKRVVNIPVENLMLPVTLDEETREIVNRYWNTLPKWAT